MVLLLVLIVVMLFHLFSLYQHRSNVCNGCLFFTNSTCTKYEKGRDAIGSCANCAHPRYQHGEMIAC